jgi:hypothetical protein
MGLCGNGGEGAYFWGHGFVRGGELEECAMSICGLLISSVRRDTGAAVP